MNIFSFKYMIALPPAFGNGCYQVYKVVHSGIISYDFASTKKRSFSASFFIDRNFKIIQVLN